MAVENVVMNLGKSVMIKGELNASEDLTLSGQMEGRVAVVEHTLTIGLTPTSAPRSRPARS